MNEPPVQHIMVEFTTPQFRMPMEHFKLPNAGERLYLRGLQDEKRKALRMERIEKERSQQGKRLNLATRSYSPRRRSASTPRPTLDGDGLRKPSVYSRLYGLSKDTAVNSSGATAHDQNNSRRQTRSMSNPSGSTPVHERLYNLAKSDVDRTKEEKPPASTRARSLSRSSGSTPVHERLYNLAKSDVDRTKEEKPPASTRTRSLSRSKANQPEESASDRLYNLAKKKRLIEDERRRLKKEQEEKDLEPKTLELVAKKSYIPLQQSISFGAEATVHSRLYQLAKARKEQGRKQEDSAPKLNPAVKKMSKETAKGVERLYGRSMEMQEEGQKRREEIAARTKKVRNQTPSKKISVEKATEIYQRGIKMKLDLEMKREKEGPSPYVSPMLNPLVINDDDDYDCRNDEFQDAGRRSISGNAAVSQIKVRTSAPRRISMPESSASHARSQTPSLYSRRTPETPLGGENGNFQGSRIRTRSRMRAPIGNNHTSLLRSSTPKPSETRHVSRPNVRGRSRTPTTRTHENSITDLLRKMEDEVSFYNNVKRAISDIRTKDDIKDLADNESGPKPDLNNDDMPHSYEHQHYQMNNVKVGREFLQSVHDRPSSRRDSLIVLEVEPDRIENERFSTVLKHSNYHD